MPETKKDTDQTVAKIIYQQIGNKARAMMGAKNHISTPNSLSFRIGKNSKKVNRIQITLNKHDLYDVEFSQVSLTPTYDIKAIASCIYADGLHKVIEEHTGMYLSL